MQPVQKAFAEAPRVTAEALLEKPKKIYSAEARGSCCFELALAEAKMQVAEALRKGPRKGRHTSI